MRKLFLIFCCFSFLFGCVRIDLNTAFQENSLSSNGLSRQDQDFSVYLASLYDQKAFPICENGLPKESCDQWFEGITADEIGLQQDFFQQNGKSPIFKNSLAFTGGLAQLFDFFSPVKKQNLITIPGQFNFYGFIAGNLQVKGRFVLAEKPIEVYEDCDFFDPYAPCKTSFPHISQLYFEVDESSHPDFQKGNRIEVGCWNSQTSSLFFDYELVDLQAKTFQFFTHIADKNFNEHIASSLSKGRQEKVLLQIAPNARYAIEDLLCPNYYFLNPRFLES